MQTEQTEHQLQEQLQEQPSPTWQDRFKRLMATSHQDETLSLEVKPEVREDVKALAAAHGMHPQDYIEHLLVTAINNNPILVEHGRERLKELRATTAAEKHQAQDEELHPSHLMASEASSHSR
jgi:predicted DNA binding CopG/RHH family protein